MEVNNHKAHKDHKAEPPIFFVGFVAFVVPCALPFLTGQSSIFRTL
jgi:hypothetical protein